MCRLAQVRDCDPEVILLGRIVAKPDKFLPVLHLSDYRCLPGVTRSVSLWLVMLAAKRFDFDAASAFSKLCAEAR
jgi:hypothetical protein